MSTKIKILKPLIILTLSLFSIRQYANASEVDSSKEAKKIAPENKNEVWPELHSWDDDTEKIYADWFKKNASAKFFSDKTGLLEGEIDVDCYRAGAVFRAVFAYRHNLRFVMKAWNKNFSSISAILDSNNTQVSGKTPEEKALNFFKLVAERTNTSTAKYNTFPVSIDLYQVNPEESTNPKYKSQISGGDVFLFEHGKSKGDGGDSGTKSSISTASRHAYLIKSVEDSGLIHFVWATVPAAARLLNERILLPNYIPLTSQIYNDWGFRRYYQPRDYENNKIERYSNLIKNQKSISDNNDLVEFEKSLIKRGYSSSSMQELVAEVQDKYQSAYNKKYSGVAKPPEHITKVGSFITDGPTTPNDLSIIKIFQQALLDRIAAGDAEKLEDNLKRNFLNLCNNAKVRVELVNEGYVHFFKKIKSGTGKPIMSAPNDFNSCLTPEDDYHYSTPSRDKELLADVIGNKIWYHENKEKLQKLTSFRRWYVMNDYLFNDGKNLLAEMKARSIIANAKVVPYRYLPEIPNYTKDPQTKSKLYSRSQIRKIESLNATFKPKVELSVTRNFYPSTEIIHNEALEFDRLNSLNLSYQYYLDKISKLGEPEDLIQYAEYLVKTTPLDEEKTQFCTLNIDFHNGTSGEMSLKEVINNIQIDNLMSSAPWVSIERRWGLRQASDEEINTENNPVCKTNAPVIDVTNEEKTNLFDSPGTVDLFKKAKK